MRVVRAKHAGACYGVQRALDMALAAVENGARATTLGPLIHNPQVVSDLEKHGIHAVETPEEATGDAVVIRSHGVTPAVRRAVAARGLALVDATCPHVARAQAAAAELARSCGRVIVVGEVGHPEVEGLVACAQEAGGQVMVARSGADIPEGVCGSVGVVVQTTQPREALESVIAALHARNIEAHLEDTVCQATRHRQEAAVDLAKVSDAIVVIGGRNSSNTTRLAEICTKICPNTHHVESANELDPAWFAGCDTVGVTAGASTPEEHIAAVEAYLEKL